MKLKKHMTIGYEGSSVEDFLSTLTAAGVTTLLDIRDIAGSRRRGFAKTAIRQLMNPPAPKRRGIGFTANLDPKH